MNYPRVTSIIQSAGLSDYSGIPENIMDAARNRGDVGHKTCELYDLKNLKIETVDERIMPYLQGWIKFLKDTGAKIEAVEQKVVSIKYGYQGTLDRIVVIGGKRGVLELKLTAELMAVTAIQEAAYLQAWNEEQHTVAPQYRKMATTRYAVRLLPDGTYELPKKGFFTPGDFNIFRACMVLANYKKEMKI